MADLPMTLALRGGTTVRRLGFGAMRITGRGVWGFPPDEAAVVALLLALAIQVQQFAGTLDPDKIHFLRR